MLNSRLAVASTNAVGLAVTTTINNHTNSASNFLSSGVLPTSAVAASKSIAISQHAQHRGFIHSTPAAAATAAAHHNRSTSNAIAPPATATPNSFSLFNSPSFFAHIHNSAAPVAAATVGSVTITAASTTSSSSSTSQVISSNHSHPLSHAHSQAQIQRAHGLSRPYSSLSAAPYLSQPYSSSIPATEQSTAAQSAHHSGHAVSNEEELFSEMDKVLDERLSVLLKSEPPAKRPSVSAAAPNSSSSSAEYSPFGIPLSRQTSRAATPVSVGKSGFTPNEMLSKLKRLDATHEEVEQFIDDIRTNFSARLKLVDYVLLVSASGKLNPQPVSPFNMRVRLKDSKNTKQKESLSAVSVGRRPAFYWRLTLEIYQDVLRIARLDPQFLPNLQFYNQVMDSLGKSGMWELSVRVFHQLTLGKHWKIFEDAMKISGNEQDKHTSATSSTSASKKTETMMESAVRVALSEHPALKMEHLQSVDPNTGNPLPLSMPPTTTQHNSRGELVLHRGFLPDVISFTILINACARAEKGSIALLFLTLMEEEYRILPDRMAYTAVIHACAKSGQSQKALAVWRRMLQHGIEPNTISYNTLINAFAKDKDVETAFNLLEEMLISPCQPTVVTYTTLLHACSQGKDWLRAQIIWNQMREKGMIKGVYTYNGMLTCACACGQIDYALEMLHDEMMANARLRPDALSYGVIINAMVSKGDEFAALDLFTEMKNQRVKPDVFVYNAVMRSQNVKAAIILQLYYEMQDRYRIKPNIVIYRDVVAACVRENRWKDVCDLLTAMIQRPVRPDQAFIEMLKHATPQVNADYKHSLELLSQLEQVAAQQLSSYSYKRRQNKNDATTADNTDFHANANTLQNIGFSSATNPHTSAPQSHAHPYQQARMYSTTANAELAQGRRFSHQQSHADTFNRATFFNNRNPTNLYRQQHQQPTHLQHQRSYHQSNLHVQNALQYDSLVQHHSQQPHVMNHNFQTQIQQTVAVEPFNYAELTHGQTEELSDQLSSRLQLSNTAEESYHSMQPHSHNHHARFQHQHQHQRLYYTGGMSWQTHPQDHAQSTFQSSSASSILSQPTDSQTIALSHS